MKLENFIFKKIIGNYTFMFFVMFTLYTLMYHFFDMDYSTADAYINSAGIVALVYGFKFYEEWKKNKTNQSTQNNYLRLSLFIA